MGMLMWIVVIVIVLIVIVIILRRRENRKSDSNVWSQVRRIKRGACGKIKDLLWGC